MSSFASPGLRIADVRDRHVVVWGDGREGRAAVDVLARHGSPASITVVVDTPDVAAVPGDSGVAASPVLSSSSSDGRSAVAQADIVVKSPGVSPYFGRFAEMTHGKVVTGGTALWFAEVGSQRSVGVTGSKGKSTTASLLHHLLTVLGETAVLAGNIGRAPIEVLGVELDRRAGVADKSLPDRWVFELSSFQCAEVTSGPEFGILTSLFPEHLNWHGSVERYYADKLNLFTDATCVLAANGANADVARLVAGRPQTNRFGVDGTISSVGRRVVDIDGSLLVDLSATKLLGVHNASNVAAAFTTLRSIGYEIATRADDLADALRLFSPLAHRLEPVGTIGERLVVDDSLSTAPQAAVAALDAYSDVPVSIIVGGFDRGLDYQPLADACASRRAPTWVLGVPESGERLIPLIAEAVRSADARHVVVEGFDDFDAAVAVAERCTPAGGVILLSPGAPSFGRFVDYQERGLHFRALLGLAPTVDGR